MDYSKIQIDRAIFYGNEATGTNPDGVGGAIAIERDSVSIQNSLFVQNSAGTVGGGVVQMFGGSINIKGSTFNQNSAPSRGAFLRASGSASIYNSIFQGNTNPGIFNFVNVKYSNIENVIQGNGIDTVGNINADPLFNNPGNPIGPDTIWGTDDDGLQLNLQSPSINEGSNIFVGSTDSLDITNSPRVSGSRIDMGAYEATIFPYYKNLSSAVKHVLLSDAISDANSGETIEVIENAVETSSVVLPLGYILNIPAAMSLLFTGSGVSFINHGTINISGIFEIKE